MDSKFVAMKRTIALLEKYDQKLPEMTQKFYTAAPQRYLVTFLVYLTILVVGFFGYSWSLCLFRQVEQFENESEPG